MRLIDVGAVQRWLADWQYGEAPNSGDTKEDKDKAIVRYEVLDIVRSGLDDPRFTIEAEPVRRGKWVKVYGEDLSMGHRPWAVCCSECGKFGDYTNYCSNCGARMLIGDEEVD